MKTAGIDACQAGWLAIRFDDDRSDYWVIRNLEDLENTFQDCDTVFIDIPIGIPDTQYKRECDELLRKELGPEYHASVFNPPIRPALYAPTYAEACVQSYSATDKKVSLQSWNITPKIREVDQLLLKNGKYCDKIYESHPELLFKILNGNEPILQKKKTNKGLKHRLELIRERHTEARDFYRDIKEDYRRNEVTEDDIVDAMVLAHFAALTKRREVKSMPESPEKDSKGLKMAIHYVE